MKKRVIWKMLVLTIVTLGIYRLYWFVKTRRELMALNPKVKIMSPWLLVIPALIVILSLIVLIGTMIGDVSSLPSHCKGYDQYGTSVTTTPAECQVQSSNWPLVFVYISIFLIWPLVVVWLWGYSKAVDTVTKGKTSFAVAMIVLLAVPDGLDILIIQDAYNKLGSKT